MTAPEVYQKLVAMFPDFAEWWDDPGNCFREADGSFTNCGVFAEFSHYVRERFGHLPASSLAELGRFIEQCVESPELENAAATCFVENVAGEQFTPVLATHFGRRAREILSYYGPVA
jgi:hypothetical protein